MSDIDIPEGDFITIKLTQKPMMEAKELTHR
jgi:hypothetical protein